jgi:hypothetical protein
MDSAPFTHRTPDKAATNEETLTSRAALVGLVRLLARQAAREALSAPPLSQENNRNDEDD